MASRDQPRWSYQRSCGCSYVLACLLTCCPSTSRSLSVASPLANYLPNCLRHPCDYVCKLGKELLWPSLACYNSAPPLWLRQVSGEGCTTSSVVRSNSDLLRLGVDPTVGRDRAHQDGSQRWAPVLRSAPRRAGSQRPVLPALWSQAHALSFKARRPPACPAPFCRSSSARGVTDTATRCMASEALSASLTTSRCRVASPSATRLALRNGPHAPQAQ